ncbi:MAG: hypothetical protein H6R00_4706 [Proteobacteria bacterium]|nr:hypothetical protein [Pseudomonadota bacterium]
MSGISAGPSRRFDAWSVAAALMALLAVVFHALMPTKDDISWLIVNAEALLDGKELYKDIIETNPPLSVLLYVPAVLVERLIGLRAELASVIITALIGLAVAHLIRRRLDLAGVEGGGRLEAAIALVFLVLPLGAYGQKDHVAALIALPFCVELGLFSDGRRKMSVSTGVLVGLSVAIKPQFALAALLPCLWMAARVWRKGERFWPFLVVNRATVTAGLLVVTFQGLVYWLFPAFFRDVLPIVLEVYVPPRQSLATLLFPLMGILVPALLILSLLYGPRTTLAEVIGAAGFGFFAAFLIQGKGWPYHLFPATSYGLFLFSAEALPRLWKERQNRSPAVALLMATTILSIHSIWMTATWTDWSALTRAIKATGIQQPTILNIAASHEVGHPSTRDAGGRWVGTFSCRWITMLATNRTLDGAKGTNRDALAAWIAYDRQVLRRDIAEKHPDLILVDRRGTFDWLAWAREDPDTARLLEGYRPVGEVTNDGDAGSIELLRRSQESGHDADAGIRG